MGIEKNLPAFAQPPIYNWPEESFVKAGIRVDVLRLDLVHPIIGGNKWMKLKGFLEHAFAEGKKGIVTKGGPWSNHIYACAWLCHTLNLECYAWIKGNPKITTAMLADAANWGTNINYISRAVFYDDAFILNFAKENNLLYIPMGGAAETGIQHVSEYLLQLQLSRYDVAICAVGTATTFGGLAFIPDNFNQVIGVDASTKDEATQKKINEWQQALPHKKLSLINDYHFGGFARYTSTLIDFMNSLFVSQHLPTDIVYTGKLLYAVHDLAGKNYFPAGADILVIHSGGQQGNRSLPYGLLQF